MRVYIVLLIGLIAGVFLFPAQSLAVDYSITNVEIDAFMQEDGFVEVKETHTYSFEDEFNGITRELVPKKDATITSVSATENGDGLEIEQDGHLYKIHRRGEDETLTVELAYIIENGVDVFADIAEFYWPFFDDRNESTYENLVITIHPPNATDDVIAFGYDEAFMTETILYDGSVVFELGEVPDNKNGDIRVAYDAALFPTATNQINEQKRAEIVQAHEELLAAAVKKAERQETLSMIAKIVLPIFSMLLFGLMLMTFIRSRLKKAAIERETEHAFTIPQSIMSMPATIVYTTGGHLPGQTMAAALLDLVRKGYVQKTDNDQFKIDQLPVGLLEHEQKLIEFLFYIVGENGVFSFDALTSYTDEKSNHSTYISTQSQWLQSVWNEIKGKDLFEKKTAYRWGIVLFSLMLIPLIILFPIYELFAAFGVSIMLFLTAILYAIFYHPKTWDGAKMTYRWKLLKYQFKEMSEDQWKSLNEDDRLRAYLYGIGINDKGMMEKNEQFVKNFSGPTDQDSSNMMTMLYFGPLASTSFLTAANETSQSTVSSSSTSVGGGGAGGGGGGSGAF